MQMKNLLILFALTFFGGFANAQTFPLPGATWLFQSSLNPFVDVYAEKWEYMGDSSLNAQIKKMKVTRKTLNPGWYPMDTTIIHVGYKYLLFSGDTVKDLDVSEAVIANFSVQAGDSLFTPFYHPLNIALLTENCTQMDSLLIFQKGVVSSTGTDTQDGINSRYYFLKYVGEEWDTITIKFAERSLITEAYWRNQPYTNFCGMINEASILHLECYYDNSFINIPCPQLDSWFEHLAVVEVQEWEGKIYPNPVSDLLNVSNPMPISAKGYIADAQGRIVRKNISIESNSLTTIPIQDLPLGMYLLNMFFGDGSHIRQQFLKVE